MQAEAFDDKGRAGSPKAMTIVLNRRVPFAPDQFEGGRNGNGDMVDLQWRGNTECDVLGYHVYRSTTGAAGTWTPVTCLGQAGSYLEATSCIDDQRPRTTRSGTTSRRSTPSSAGTIRNGDASTVLQVDSGNPVPSQPTNLTACLGGTPGCVRARWHARLRRFDRDTLGRRARTPTASSSTGSTATASTYADRVGVFFPGLRPAAWTDPDTPSGPHTYAVSAVDPFFGESKLSAPVVNFP